MSPGATDASAQRARRVGRALAWLGVAAGLLGAAGGGAAWAHRWALARLPTGERCLAGVRLAGALPTDDETAQAFAARRKGEILSTRLRLRDDDAAPLDVTLGELGATVDVEAALRALRRAGREGDLEERVRTSFAAERGELDVPLRAEVPVEALAERLAERKDEGDERPRPARFDFSRPGAPTVRRDEPGRSLDVYALAAAIERAVNEGLRRGAPASTLELGLPWAEVRGLATSEQVERVDARVQLARYETVYGAAGGQAGRGSNIARAASGMDGVVIFPGQTVSFNENVGARSVENGFAAAAEIYKGEMRQGIGGGTCQVAGTLHAAAFFGGLDVVQRSNHSRPSGYIGLGLDATVVYPEVDLQLRNPFDFPVVLRARTEVVGGFGKLVVEVLGASRPAEVALATETLGRVAYKRKVEERDGLPEGQFRLKQRGIRGITVKKTRTLKLASGGQRVEVTVDVYPPTQEVYVVPRGLDPALLPPPPEAGAPQQSG